MSSEQECKTCFGTGMIEHSRCHGRGCDGCEDGEIVCHKCDGLGYLTRGKDEPEDSDIEIEEEEDGDIEGTEDET